MIRVQGLKPLAEYVVFLGGRWPAILGLPHEQGVNGIAFGELNLVQILHVDLFTPPDLGDDIVNIEPRGVSFVVNDREFWFGGGNLSSSPRWYFIYFSNIKNI